MILLKFLHNFSAHSASGFALVMNVLNLEARVRKPFVNECHPNAGRAIVKKRKPATHMLVVLEAC